MYHHQQYPDRKEPIPEKCPLCQSSGTLRRSGYYYGLLGPAQRYRCRACGRLSRTDLSRNAQCESARELGLQLLDSGLSLRQVGVALMERDEYWPSTMTVLRWKRRREAERARATG